MKGILYVVFASIIFGLTPFFAKTAFNNGLNEYSFILVRCILASLVLYLYIFIKGIGFELNNKEKKDIVMVSILGHGIMVLTLVSSYKYMQTGIATAIHFVYPIIIMIGGVKFYNEKINLQKIILLITAVIGIFFIIGFDNNEKISLLGFMLSLVSGFLFAYYVLVLGSGSLKKFNSIKLIFYVSITNSLFFLFACILTGSFDLNITQKGFYYVFIYSLLHVFAMIFLKKGLEKINIVTAAILSTSEPLTSLIAGLFLLKEIFQFHQIIGSILIIISAVLATIVEKQNSKKLKLQLKGEAK